MEKQEIEVHTKTMIRGEVMAVSVWTPFGKGCLKQTLWQDGEEHSSEFNHLFNLRNFIIHEPTMMQITESDYAKYKEEFERKKSG